MTSTTPRLLGAALPGTRVSSVKAVDLTSTSAEGHVTPVFSGLASTE
jgi:hypothetical protein